MSYGGAQSKDKVDKGKKSINKTNVSNRPSGQHRSSSLGSKQIRLKSLRSSQPAPRWSLSSDGSSKKSEDSYRDVDMFHHAADGRRHIVRLRQGGSFTRMLPEFNAKAINNQLLDIVQYIENIPKKGLHELKALLASIPDTERKRRFFTGWTDPRGIDLLQCAIIHKKLDIMDLLLKDAQLFPPHHFPKMNPYGHLAATIGCIDGLKTLLAYRPDDYFPCTDSHHAVKLPPDIVRNLKITMSHGMVNKTLERVVNMVKAEASRAERTLADPLEQMSNVFEEEMESLEQSFKVEGKKPRKRGVYSCRHNHNAASTQPSQAPRGGYLQTEECDSCRIKPIVTKKKDKVTVYMDMNDPSLDIVCDRKDSTPDRRLSAEPQPLGPAMGGRMSGRDFKSMKIGSTNRVRMSENIELGVRRIKKYKSFHPILMEPKSLHIEESSRFMGKTPLTLAAEKNNYECVTFLLQKYHMSKHVTRESKNNGLYLATCARSIEAIAILMKATVFFKDYENAVTLCINKMYPDCLSVLISLGEKNRTFLFGGDNLFHVLYTTCLANNNENVEMLPEMTRVLIGCKEDVNAKSHRRHYALYTLIQSAFRVHTGKKSLYFLTCFKMLLTERANPHYDEETRRDFSGQDVLVLSRPAYNSAVHCILDNAHRSLKYFENKRWTFLVLQKFMDILEAYDRTPRKILNDVLFVYIDYVNQLGLNRRTLRTLLRYGGNPDYMIEGRYPLNAVFEEMYSFLTKFEVCNKLYTLDTLLDTLLILCRAMSPGCLQRAVSYFLQNHLLSCPLQALGLTKKFSYYSNAMTVSPRSLTHITSLYIWIRVRRNSRNVRKLPVSEDIMNLILP